MLDALQNVLIYGGSFLVVLTLVTFVHEFGHFQVARWLKIKVDTFCVLGWGKTFISWRDKHGVKWGVAPFPVGAYVSFADDHERYGPGLLHVEDADKRDLAREEGVMRAQPPAAKAAVSVGGPFANFIFSVVAFAAVFLIMGKDVTDRAALSPRIDTVSAGSAAAAAGLQPGDLVREIDGRAVQTWGELQESIGASSKEGIRLVVERSGAILTVVATPTIAESVGPSGERIERLLLGVGRSVTSEERVIDRLNPIEAVVAGGGQVWTIISTTVSYLANIITGRASAEHIAGPAGILDMSGQVAKGSFSGAEGATLGDRLETLALGLLFWAATLSVAVGFMNLLPVPVLDGGHLVFYAIEAARGGRPVPQRAQEIAIQGGMVAIAALFIFATWNDIQRFLG